VATIGLLNARRAAQAAARENAAVAEPAADAPLEGEAD